MAAALLQAHLRIENPENTQIASPWPVLESFHHVMDRLFLRQEHNMADLVHDVTKCVESGGRVYYVGEENLGAMAVITATESAYKYGTESRAFVRRVNSSSSNTSSTVAKPDLHQTTSVPGNESSFSPGSVQSSSKDVVMSVDEDKFVDTVVPTLTKTDLVVYLASNLETIPEFLNESGTSIIVVNFISSSSKKLKLHLVARCKSVIQVIIPEVDQPARQTRIFDKLAAIFLKQLACRLVCNICELAVHIKLGKVYRNILADFTIGNYTSFHRAAKYLQFIAKMNWEEARQLLLKCIYEKDMVAAELYKSMDEHIDKALDTDHVMMTAVYCAVTECSSIEAAFVTVRQQPNLDTLLVSS